MSRSSAGSYTLPLPPVNPGDFVQAQWANDTLSDIAQALTDSLDRYGRGGMLAPFKFLDGDVTAPGITWTNEPGLGFYRDVAGVVGLAISGVQAVKFAAAGVTAAEFFSTATTPTSDTSLISKAYANLTYQAIATAWNTSNFDPATKQNVSTAWNTTNFNPANYAALNSSPSFSTVTASAVNVTNLRNFNQCRSVLFIATPSP